MFKIMGALLIIFAGSMIGLYKAAQYANRPRQIRQLIQGLQRLETEISYGFTPLPEALMNISKPLKSPLKEMFRQAADELGYHGHDPSHDHQYITVTEAWNKAIIDHWRRTAMKATEQEIISILGSTLGISDREDQVKHIQLAIHQLQSEEVEAGEDQRRYEKMWKSLGVLAGILIVILMY